MLLNLTKKEYEKRIKDNFKRIKEVYNEYIKFKIDMKKISYEKNLMTLPKNIKEEIETNFFKKDKKGKPIYYHDEFWMLTAKEILYCLQEIEEYREKLLYLKQNDLKEFDKYKSSKIKLKFQTNRKNIKLENLFKIYEKELIYRINKNRNNKKLKKKSSKDIEEKYIKNSRYKEIIYKHSIDIIKKIKKEDIENFSITLDSRFFSLINKEISGKIYDFIKIKLPFRNYKYKNRYETISIPYKITKHMRKLIKRGYKPINCVRLYKKGSEFYISFVYHKNTTKDFMFKTFFKDDKFLGIDLNFQNFMSLSDGSHISPKFEKYIEIKRKKKNSKNFNNLKKEIQKEAYEKLKSINFSKYSCIVIDDYYSNGFSDVGNNENKLKRWTLDYEKKLKDLCEENGVQFIKVGASFIRDITCPECGKKHKTDSKAIHKAFQEGFKCNYCNHYFLPDTVEAINKVKNNNTRRIHNTFAQQKKTKQLKKQNYGEFKLLKYLKSIKWLFYKPDFVLTKFIDKLINIDEYFNNQYFYNSIKYIYKLKTS